MCLIGVDLVMETLSGFRGDDFNGDLRNAREKSLGAPIWASLDYDRDIRAHQFVFGELVGALGKDEVTGGAASEVGQALEETTFEDLMRLVGVRQGFVPDFTIDQLPLDSIDFWDGEELGYGYF